MTPDQLLAVKALFLEVSALPPAQWQSFLDGRTDVQGEVRAWVEEQLKELEHGESALLPPVQLSGSLRLEPGELVGGYKLLERIGEGGFGVVWMAQQHEPVERKVALKVIKAGMDSEQVVRRFEAERQALAIMDHPNIARVFDGGTTVHGRPYFVMELVRGIPITEYCDQARADTRQRIDLFQVVCHAVQHAHQKGVIHRDIKPSNVLVTEIDGRPSPKVIDFGIAKATSASLTQKTLFTSFGQMVGTPDYMAPEQTTLSGLDVDTRADIYSLGVLLYELLTGSPPFSVRELLGQGYEEMLRMVRELDPPSPSTRASSEASGAEVVACRCCADPSELSRLLAGDLDWIVMKALEKQRDRRYDTPDALADDLARHLNHEPVLASPPSVAYRLRKYVRRNRVVVAAVSAIVVSLLAGATFAFSFALRERDQRNAADAARDGLASLVEVLKGRDPFLSDDQLISDKEALDLAAAQVERAFPDQPLQRVELHKFLGAAYWRIGEIQAAVQQMDIAATELDRLPDVDPLRARSLLMPRVFMYQHLGITSTQRIRPGTLLRAVMESIAAGDPELERMARELVSWSHRWRFPLTQTLALEQFAELESSLIQQGAGAPRWAALGDLAVFVGYGVGQALGVWADSDAWFELAAGTYRGRAGFEPTHILLALLQMERLTSLYRAGNLEKLGELARGHADVYGSVLPSDHWLLDSLDAWEAIAGASLDPNPEAYLPSLRQSFEELEGILGSGHYRVRSILANLVEVAKAANAPDAEDLRVQLVSSCAQHPDFGGVTLEVIETMLAGHPTVDRLRELYRLWTEEPYSDVYGQSVVERVSEIIQACESLSGEEVICVARWMLSLSPCHTEKSGSDETSRLHLREMYEFLARIEWSEDLSDVRKEINTELAHLFWYNDGNAERSLAAMRAGVRDDFVFSRVLYGRRLMDAGQPEEGFQVVEEAYQSLLDLHLRLNIFSVYGCRNLLNAYVVLGRHRGELEESLQAGARVASDYLEELLRGGTDADSLHQLAWAVVRATGLGPLDYTRALQAAREGIEQLKVYGLPSTNRGLSADLHGTCALAELRLGNRGAAVSRARRAIELRVEHGLSPSTTDVAVLALALAGTGQRLEARAALERAQAEAAALDDPLLHALISEAEAELR